MTAIQQNFRAKGPGLPLLVLVLVLACGGDDAPTAPIAEPFTGVITGTVTDADRGVPIGGAVARELGHRSTTMIEDRCGHLHDRTEDGGSEVVEFRAHTFRHKLADRLEALERRTAAGDGGAGAL